MGAQGNKDQLREGAQGSGVWSSGYPGLLGAWNSHASWWSSRRWAGTGGLESREQGASRGPRVCPGYTVGASGALCLQAECGAGP